MKKNKKQIEYPAKSANEMPFFFKLPRCSAITTTHTEGESNK